MNKISLEQQPILEAKTIGKTYHTGTKSVQILSGCSAEFHKGETVSIMGASGSGKTTFLYALSGMERPTEGQVLFNGQSLYGLRSNRRTQIRARNIGFVFQAYYLLPELDVLENVMLPLINIYGASKANTEYKTRAIELLERVGLSERCEHLPTELSGGEQQRAALARALVIEPDIVMADEPTGNLDSETGKVALQYIFDLIKEQGHTLILVTHDQNVAARCDRKLLLRDGQLTDGQPA